MAPWVSAASRRSLPRSAVSAHSCWWRLALAVLEPYRPILIGAALVALFFAYRRIFRPAQACKPEEVCAVPQVKTAQKIIFVIVATLTGLAFAFPYILPLLY